ncbi:MAG: dihydrofolate reductase [Prevotella sp.]|nr:dihydrofolate reductase [Prevotella sp.]
MINMIAAVARNRAIGFENKLLYWLPNDLKRFKQLTTGHTILMGRRTFESLPKGALPNRRNCVLTKKGIEGVEEFISADKATSLEFFGSWDEFLITCMPDEEIFIIGGATLYNNLLDKADRLCLTEIDDVPAQADAFFPDFPRGNGRGEWHETSHEEHAADERHAHAYSFVDYER